METKALDYGSPRMDYGNPSVEYGSVGVRIQPFISDSQPKTLSTVRGIPHQDSNATCYGIHVGIP